MSETNKMTRKEFVNLAGLTGASLLILNGCDLFVSDNERISGNTEGVSIQSPKVDEDIFKYVQRIKGKFDIKLYRQVLGAANEFKEGDQSIKISAVDEESRNYARQLLGNTQIARLNKTSVYRDEILDLIQQSITANPNLDNWTMQELKIFLLTKPELQIKEIIPSLSSDVIACVVKLMTNEELIQVSKKVFNPLPDSKIGSKGYMGARVQPNSPTDNIEDISWQVFNAWSYAVGDVVFRNKPSFQ